MPTHRPATNALAHLRHLARLDASGPELIAPVLASLHALIGFDSSGYFHPGAGGELDVHMEHPAVQAAVPDHFDPRILASETRVFHNVLQHGDDIARHPRGPQSLAQMLRVPAAELLRSDYYNVVMRPAGVADWLSLPLRAPQGQGVGMLFLFRPAGARPFGDEDLATLARLQACLARVLCPGGVDAGGEVLREGVLVATPLGQPLWASPEAEALMARALGWRWRGVGRAVGRAPLPHALQLLIQRLRLPGAPAPEMALRNAHGAFHLRAAPLAAATGPGEAVALHITQRMAPAARLLEALDQAGLPPRQRELAYWIARGLPESRIAGCMGISVNTVVYHRRQLYASLGVASRAELLECLALGDMV